MPPMVRFFVGQRFYLCRTDGPHIRYIFILESATRVAHRMRRFSEPPPSGIFSLLALAEPYSSSTWPYSRPSARLRASQSVGEMAGTGERSKPRASRVTSGLAFAFSRKGRPSNLPGPSSPGPPPAGSPAARAPPARIPSATRRWPAVPSANPYSGSARRRHR